MSILIEDSSGGNLLNKFQLPDEEPRKVIVSNFNEMMVVPVSKEEFIGDFRYGGRRISERLYYNYLTTDTFEQLFPSIPGGVYPPELNAFTLKLLVDDLNNLPEGLRDSINNILILPDERFFSLAMQSGASRDSMAFANPDGVIVLKQSAFENEDGRFIISHEAGHTKTFVLEEQRKAELAQMNWRESICEKFICAIESTFGSREPSYMGGLYQSDFEVEWNDLTGDYGRYTIDPENTFVEPYGSTDFFEDVATYVGKINGGEEGRKIFEELIDPDNYLH